MACPENIVAPEVPRDALVLVPERQAVVDPVRGVGPPLHAERITSSGPGATTRDRVRERPTYHKGSSDVDRHISQAVGRHDALYVVRLVQEDHGGVLVASSEG